MTRDEYQQKFPGLVEFNAKHPHKPFKLDWEYPVPDGPQDVTRYHGGTKRKQVRAKRKAAKLARRKTRFLDKSRKYDIRGRKSL